MNALGLLLVIGIKICLMLWALNWIAYVVHNGAQWYDAIAVYFLIRTSLALRWDMSNQTIVLKM